MNCTQNEKLKQVTEQTIVIGVDIASETHYARVFDWRGVELDKVFMFANNAEGFERLMTWSSKVMERAAKSRMIVGAEPTGHYWFGLAEYLRQKAATLVLVNPFHVKRSKELDDNHPSKTDRKDPKTIAKLVIDGRFNIPYIPEGVYAELRVVITCRDRVVSEMTTVKNRIERWLKIYFPEYQDVFGAFDAKSSLKVLQTVPLPADVVQMGVEGVNQLWRAAKLRAVGMKRAKSLYEAAQRSIGCKEGSAMARIELKLLLEDYRAKMSQHEALMTVIEGLCKQIPAVINSFCTKRLRQKRHARAAQQTSLQVQKSR